MTKTKVRKLIPKGWRELEYNETISNGGQWFDGNSSHTQPVSDSIGKPYSLYWNDPIWIVITQSPKPMNTNNLNITKDKVLEAADKCSQAREVLKTLFPEAFEDKSIVVDKRFITCVSNIDIRVDCEYKNKAIWLSDRYNWEIKKDNNSQLCLVPTRKD